MPFPYVVCGAKLMCPFGMAPSVLTIAPGVRNVMIGNMPAANIMDFAPMVNIPTFGMCVNPANPVVAAATAAAMGVLTPMPCIPAIVAPWAPGSPNVLVQKMPALLQTSTCQCMWGGVITITHDGQMGQGYTTTK